MMYRANKGLNNTFPVHIISFNQITGIVDASFEGPALDITTSPISNLNIRRGRFKGRFTVTIL